MHGIVRGLDPQRRITIPKPTLTAAGIEQGELVEIWAGQDDDGAPCVLVRRFVLGCCICGTKGESYVKLEDKKICLDCVSCLVELSKEVT